MSAKHPKGMEQFTEVVNNVKEDEEPQLDLNVGLNPAAFIAARISVHAPSRADKRHNHNALVFLSVGHRFVSQWKERRQSRRCQNRQLYRRLLPLKLFGIFRGSNGAASNGQHLWGAFHIVLRGATLLRRDNRRGGFRDGLSPTQILSSRQPRRPSDGMLVAKRRRFTSSIP